MHTLGGTHLGLHTSCSHTKKITKNNCFFALFFLALHARPFLPLPTMGAQAWHDGQSDSSSHLRRHCPPEQTWEFRSQLGFLSFKCLFLLHANCAYSFPHCFGTQHLSFAQDILALVHTEQPPEVVVGTQILKKNIYSSFFFCSKVFRT